LARRRKPLDGTTIEEPDRHIEPSAGFSAGLAHVEAVLHLYHCRSSALEAQAGAVLNPSTPAPRR
jgi:hypothetical protein